MANVEEAAQRLLQALNEHQAHDREGAPVKPGDQEARYAMLGVGSNLYRAAMRWLLDVVPDEEANEQLRNAVGAQHRGFAFKITRHGLNMLRGV